MRHKKQRTRTRRSPRRPKGFLAHLVVLMFGVVFSLLKHLRGRPLATSVLLRGHYRHRQLIEQVRVETSGRRQVQQHVKALCRDGQRVAGPVVDSLPERRALYLEQQAQRRSFHIRVVVWELAFLRVVFERRQQPWVSHLSEDAGVALTGTYTTFQITMLATPMETTPIVITTVKMMMELQPEIRASAPTQMKHI